MQGPDEHINSAAEESHKGIDYILSHHWARAARGDGCALDEGDGAAVGGALQLQGERLKGAGGAACGGVGPAAHRHVEAHRHVAHGRVHHALAHQPIRQVTRPRHLPHQTAFINIHGSHRLLLHLPRPLTTRRKIALKEQAPPEVPSVHRLPDQHAVTEPCQEST